MKIHQFRYFSDNLGYLVVSGTEAVAIDAGVDDGMLEFASENKIRITIVTNTHQHPDHTSGNKLLLEKTDAVFMDCSQFSDGQKISVGDSELTVITTPGHTMDSVTFLGTGFIISGDTLFNGTVGNCFTGDLHAFFASLKKIMDLPASTRVYGGHDYVVESMNVARTIEPENQAIEKYLKNYNPRLIVSTLEDELKANPYIRFNTDEMVEKIKQNGLPYQTEYNRFESVMENF